MHQHIGPFRGLFRWVGNIITMRNIVAIGVGPEMFAPCFFRLGGAQAIGFQGDGGSFSAIASRVDALMSAATSSIGRLTNFLKSYAFWVFFV
jgi:hypothetical protein